MTYRSHRRKVRFLFEVRENRKSILYYRKISVWLIRFSGTPRYCELNPFLMDTSVQQYIKGYLNRSNLLGRTSFCFAVTSVLRCLSRNIPSSVTCCYHLL